MQCTPSMLLRWNGPCSPVMQRYQITLVPLYCAMVCLRVMSHPVEMGWSLFQLQLRGAKLLFLLSCAMLCLHIMTRCF